MARVVQKVATVVAAVATLAAPFLGPLAPVALLVAAAATAVATIASLAIKSPGGTVGGNATKFKIDKDAGLPYVMGRTFVGGNVVHRQYYGPKQVFESWVTALSLGPVKSVGPLLIDKVAVAMAGTAVLGSFAGFMWCDTQLGACPEARALAGPQGAFPGWDATSKLSGLAADLWTLKFDTKGKKFPNGVPQRGRVLEGVLVYDARQDSTYPGGSGPCRLGDESTYVYSENPACHAVTWAFGRYQNGVLVAGGGLGVTGIDLAPFVEWSNVCDANGWKVGGQVYTTADNKWDVLKMIAQAGAGEVLPSGAMLSCMFSAPRVSIGTITSADIIGDIDTPSTASIRQRRNTIIPRVRLEAQGWEEVPLDPVSVPDYVALDGAKRPREVSYPLVQDPNQGARLAMYEMLNARELDGILLPCKIYALGYRPGDCLTVDIPEASLVNRTVILREREIDAASMGVTLTCRSETASKHPFALGVSGIPPRTPDLSIPGIDQSAPAAEDWSAAGVTLSANGASIPALVVTGAVGNPNASAVAFDYRPYVAGAAADAGWSAASIDPAETTRREFGTVTPGTQYEIGVRYQVRGVLGARLTLGPVTAGALSTSSTEQLLIQNSSNADVVITSADTGSGAASITIGAHTRRYTDKNVSVNGATLAGLANGASYLLYYDDAARAGGAVTYHATTSYTEAFLSVDHPARHYVGSVTTAQAGGGSTGGGGATPPGGGRYNPNELDP